LVACNVANDAWFRAALGRILFDDNDGQIKAMWIDHT